MTSLTTEQLFAHATEFQFLPAGAERGGSDVQYFTVAVVLRGPDLYAITHMGDCWDGTDWVYESLPSSRTDEFKARARFPLVEAVALARSFPNTMSVNGATWAQWQERFAGAGRKAA